MQPEVLLAVNTLLLGVVSFFLKSLHNRFEKLEAEVKAGLVSNAVEAQRLSQTSRDVSELKQIVMSTYFQKKDV